MQSRVHAGFVYVYCLNCTLTKHLWPYYKLSNPCSNFNCCSRPILYCSMISWNQVSSMYIFAHCWPSQGTYSGVINHVNSCNSVDKCNCQINKLNSFLQWCTNVCTPVLGTMEWANSSWSPISRSSRDKYLFITAQKQWRGNWILILGFQGYMYVQCVWGGYLLVHNIQFYWWCSKNEKVNWCTTMYRK